MDNSSSARSSLLHKGNETLGSLLAPVGRMWKSFIRRLIHNWQDVDLREELEIMKRSLAEVTQERDRAKDEIEEKSEALAAVQHERDTLNRRTEELSSKSKGLVDQIAMLNSQLGQEMGQKDGLKQQLERREMELQIVTNELVQTRTKYTETSTLLDLRTSELKGAQTFLTKADSVAGADVVRMVEGLDAEILQTAAFMADHFVFDGGKQGMNDEVHEAVGRLGELLGPRMVDLLGSTDHAHDPTLIQLACQATITAYCRYIIASWDFDDEHYNQFLKDIYATVHEAEDQAISGRWRALTRTHVQSMLHGDMDVSFNLLPHIAHSLTDILLVAGLNAANEHIHEEITSTFGDKLMIVIQAALALNWVVGKDITSADLEPIVAVYEAVFDPAVMEDVNGNGGLRAGIEHVLCTTDLGLQRIVGKSSKSKDGAAVPASSQQTTTTITTILLKPKVALESMIEGLHDIKITDSPAGMEGHELTPNGHT